MDTKDTFWAKKAKEGKYNYIHNIQFPGKYNIWVILSEIPLI